MRLPGARTPSPRSFHRPFLFSLSSEDSRGFTNCLDASKHMIHFSILCAENAPVFGTAVLLDVASALAIAPLKPVSGIRRSRFYSLPRVALLCTSLGENPHC